MRLARLRPEAAHELSLDHSVFFIFADSQMILRPELRFHRAGNPILSFRAIEAYSLAFLNRWFPKNLTNPAILSPVDLLNLLKSEDAVGYSFAELGEFEGRKRLGRMNFTRKLITLDPCLLDSRKISLAFVAAHEAAHWLLHRDVSVGRIRSAEATFDDDESREQQGHPGFSRSPMEWIEWQASTLAAALLIPSTTAPVSIAEIHEVEIPTRRAPLVIYCNTSPEGRTETSIKLGIFGAKYGVSKTVAKIRLKRLGLYVEQLR